jgi:general secretion pathway protein K
MRRGPTRRPTRHGDREDGRESGQESGFALITTLWCTVVVALIVTVFAVEGRTRALRARNAADLVVARELARSAVHVAMADLLAKPGAGRLPRDGTVVSLAMPGGKITLRVEDERGKLDVAQARSEAVAALFRSIGQRHGIDAFAAVDLARQAGRQFGREADGERAPTLRSLVELRRFEGFSSAFVGDLEAHATVFGFGARVNPATASREVLQALGTLDRRSIDAYLGVRGSGVQLDEDRVLPEGLTTAQGPVYRLVGTGQTARGIEETVVAIVAKVSGAFEGQDTIRVLEWR